MRGLDMSGIDEQSIKSCTCCTTPKIYAKQYWRVLDSKRAVLGWLNPEGYGRHQVNIISKARPYSKELSTKFIENMDSLVCYLCKKRITSDSEEFVIFKSCAKRYLRLV